MKTFNLIIVILGANKYLNACGSSCSSKLLEHKYVRKLIVRGVTLRLCTPDGVSGSKA